MARNRIDPKILHFLLHAVIGLVGLATSVVHGAEIRLAGTNSYGTPVVTLSGSLVSQDIERFADVTKEFNSAIISFNSLGGNLSAGIEIGTRIRLRGYQTTVANGNECYSACALAWLGGTTRFAGERSQIGFHAAYLEQGSRLLETGLGNALVGAYANGLGLRTAAIVFLTSAPPEGLNRLTEIEALRTGISVDFGMDEGLVEIPASTVVQRAILYVEDGNDPKAAPRATAGSVYWTFIPHGPEQDAPSIRATVRIPDASLSLTMTIRRNRDKTLPASHTVELLFAAANNAGWIVRDVGLLQFKDDESVRGAPVAGLPVPVSDNFFLIGLSGIPSDIQRNMDLLASRNWIDMPIRFASGNRAILTFEKGDSGREVVSQMLKEEARLGAEEARARAADEQRAWEARQREEQEMLRRLLEGQPGGAATNDERARSAPLPISPPLQLLSPNSALR